MSRKLLYLFGGVILLVAVAGVVLILLQRRAATPPANVNGSSAIPNVNTVILNTNATAANVNSALTNANQDPRNEVQQLGASFASIYASFSSQNNYANITDLYFYMTPALKANQQAYVAQQQSQAQDTSIYHGISSIARIVAVQNFDLARGEATVKVTLQRVETSGSSNNTQTYNQDITLGFERLQDTWKVGRITWGVKQ